VPGGQRQGGCSKQITQLKNIALSPKRNGRQIRVEISDLKVQEDQTKLSTSTGIKTKYWTVACQSFVLIKASRP